MFKLGIITDEVTQDFKAAVAFAKKHALDGVEIRSVWGKDPFELDKNDVLKIKELLIGQDIAVCAISSPLYKCDFYNKNEVSNHIEGLKRCIEWANILDAKIIRSFDFWACQEKPISLDNRAEKFILPSELTEKHGITLALEYDPSVNSTNCEKIAQLVNRIDKPNVKALYDPGNDIYSPDQEVPYPDGYHFLKDFCHVHIKDAIRENGKTIATPVGDGDVDYKGIFHELIQKKYDGYVVLETHYKPKMQMDEALLKLPKGEAISYLGEIASEESMIKLKKIIKDCEEEIS